MASNGRGTGFPLLGAAAVVAALLIRSSGAGGVAAQDAAAGFREDLENQVARLRDDTGLTAVAAAVMIGGQLAGAAASGERRRDSGVTVTVHDRWHLGSVTKSMTATLLAVLENEGRLTFDGTLPELLPGIEMADGWRACTLHHLLTHTAGAPANFASGFQEVWPDTLEELVAERRRHVAGVLTGEPLSPCGERFVYSNVGYTIAGHIAETLAGEPYETLIRNRVFAPLALPSAGFGPPRGAHPGEEPVGHLILQDRRIPQDPFETRADNSPLIAPAGTVHMTIGDLARYGVVHLDGEFGPEPVLLPRSSWERLHAPFLEDYAAGWVRGDRDWAGGPVIWHNGSNTYWYALLMLLPANDAVFAFTTNDGAVRTAETAFLELVWELSEPAGQLRRMAERMRGSPRR